MLRALHFIHIFATNVILCTVMGNSLKESNLTRRESEIVEMLSRGLTEKEIAEHLFISAYTVNNHMKSIRSKLNLTKNIEVVLYAIAKKNKKKFSIEEIRKFGVSVILVLIHVCELTSPQ